MISMIGKKPLEKVKKRWLVTAVLDPQIVVARTDQTHLARLFPSWSEAEAFIDLFNLGKDYCVYPAF